LPHLIERSTPETQTIEVDLGPAKEGPVDPVDPHVQRLRFDERATHAFPPAFIMPAEWHPELETLAPEMAGHRSGHPSPSSTIEKLFSKVRSYTYFVQTG
jgi:hypothetical protein